MAQRLTWRELRLLDWMTAPQHDNLPNHPAIEWRHALWKVSDLARLSGVCRSYTNAMCRHDLDALAARGLVTQIVPGRWRVGG